MSNTPRPQDTGCTTVEFASEGVTNGVLSMVSNHYPVEYDEGKDTYYVLDRGTNSQPGP